MGAVENRQRKNPAQMLDSLKRGEMTAEILDALTKDNVQITAEEVKKVTGLGDKGSELIAKLANRDGVTFSQAEQAVKTAYNAGFTGLDGAKVNFATETQIDAFTAGKKDAAMNRPKAQGQAVQILEKDLIQQGVPLTDRRNIIQAATEVEGTLAGTKQSISSVVSGVRKITNNIAKAISQKVGNVQNLWGLLHTNLKALQSDAVSPNRDLVSAYAATYLNALKNNESGRYNEISAGVQNVSGALTKYLETGIMPESVQNQDAFLSAAEEIADIVRLAEDMIENAKGQLYGIDVLSRKNSDDIIKTSTGAKVSYALSGNEKQEKKGANYSLKKEYWKTDLTKAQLRRVEGWIRQVGNHHEKRITDVDAQSGVMWTIADGVLTKKDVNLFYQEIAKLNYRNSRNYQVSSNGEYIFDIENKLIYTDGNYSSPTITKVISFDSVYEDDISLAKELILNEEGAQSEIDDAIETIEILYGPGFVTATNIEDSGAYARQVRGRKGADSRETHRTGEADVEREQDNISYSFDNDTDKSEVNENESERREDLLHDDGSKRKYSKSAGGQTRKVDGRSRRYKEGRKAASERRKRCAALKAAGHTRKRVILGHRCEVISKEHYDSEMAKLVRENEKNGIDETILVVGGIEIPKVDSKGKVKTAKGMFIETKDGRKIVVVQCDNEHYSPKQINDHELVHNDYGSERTKRVKNIILKTLPAKMRNELLGIIQDDYSGVLEDLEGDALEELVANILSGMHSLSDTFLELSKAYWNKDDALIKRWEYEVNKKSFARAVEKGYASEMERINRQLVYAEHAQLREYIVSVNNSRKKMRQTDCKEIGNNFYIWRNKSKTDYEVLFSIPLEGNKEEINFIRGELDVNDRRKKGIFDLLEALDERYGNDNRGGSADQDVRARKTTLPIHKNQSKGDRRGNSEESNRDTSGNRVKYALDKNGMWEMEHIFENDDPEAEAAMMQDWKALLEKYGAIPSGEKPYRDVQVPKKTAKNKKVSQTVEKVRSTASGNKIIKIFTKKNNIFTFYNRAVSIEETALLLAFYNHKLCRTIVRRRICVCKIYLPF